MAWNNGQNPAGNDPGSIGCDPNGGTDYNGYALNPAPGNGGYAPNSGYVPDTVDPAGYGYDPNAVNPNGSYAPNPYYGPAGAPVRAGTPGKGLAIACMACGISSAVCALLGFIPIVGFFFSFMGIGIGIAALILSARAKQAGYEGVFRQVGFGTGLGGLICSGGALIFQIVRTIVRLIIYRDPMYSIYYGLFNIFRLFG